MNVCTYVNGICERHGIPHINDQIKHLCSLATDEGEMVRVALDMKVRGYGYGCTSQRFGCTSQRYYGNTSQHSSTGSITNNGYDPTVFNNPAILINPAIYGG